MKGNFSTERASEMIDIWDYKQYCHWDGDLVCKRRYLCGGCPHQPDDDEKGNGKAEPVHIRWVVDCDGSKIPECPSCGEMPYSVKRCTFCGQKFLTDAIADAWNEPLEEERMDCLVCGGKGTIVGTRAKSNGHFHGRCTACGCLVME